MNRHLPPPPGDLDQLTGALDAPVAPAPAFAARLRAEVHRHASATLASQAVPPASTSDGALPLRQKTGSNSSPASPRTTALPRSRSPWGRRLEPALAAAVLVLMVAGVVIGLARVQDRGHHPERDQGVGAIATPMQTPNAAVNWGGDPGHSNTFALPEFDAGQVTIGQGGENSGFANRTSAISNGSIIVTQRPQLSETDGPILEAFSLKGPALWQVPIAAMPGMAIDGERLYLIRDDLTNNTVSRPLTAISLATGEVLWTGPDVETNGKSTWGWSPIVVGTTVYIANGKGSAWAVDTATGATRWASMIPDDAVPDRADGSSETPTGGSLAFGDGALWVAGWTNTIHKLDPASGDVLATITLDPGMRELDLYLRDTTLVARTNVRAAAGNVQSTILAIDTQTDAIRWIQPTPVRISDHLVLLHDRVIVPRVDTGVTPMLNVDAYNLQTGAHTSIPMPSLETPAASLSAIDGPNPLLLIASFDGALTVVNIGTGDVVATLAAPSTAAPATTRPLPVLLVGGEALIVAQGNGNWYRIAPG